MMSERKVKNRYSVTLIISLFLLLFTLITKQCYLNIIISLICGFYNIIYTIKNEKMLLTPLTIFSLIWLVLIPITSFQFPLMKELSDFEWINILIFIIFFSFGGLIVLNFKQELKNKKRKANKLILKINLIVLIFSIFAIIISIIKYGEIPLFASDANIAKFNYKTTNHFLNFFIYFGYGAIIYFAIDDLKNFKKISILSSSILYLLCNVLTGERFSIIITCILIAFTTIKKKVTKKYIKYIIILSFIIIGIFLFVLQYRGNSSQKDKYFIQTGIYSGTAQTLENTEIFRYFGMAFRLITPTYIYINPGETFGQLTLSPLLKIFGITAASRGIDIYAYNAVSIITPLYSDFGYFWPIAVIILSIIINNLYRNYNEKSSIFYTYITISFMMLLMFSFYSYFNFLIIYFLHIPIYILFLDVLNRIRRR